ncbi:exo-beta-1,3-glucanase [Hysterangium stoloniferum]|nr:exo-beta-1,3-glucanase [Hysterangium stoloniferum]
MWHLLLNLTIAVNLVLQVLGIGTSCTVPLGAGTADPTAPYWLETIEKRGTSPFNQNQFYNVFRNVKSYGAVGDGITDDTVAINKAMAEGARCGKDCDSSTVSPALVYFPPGTYLVSAPIVAWYYTAIVGDPKNLPVLLADPSFVGIAVIDANPYIPLGYGKQWYINQNNFFRSVRNFIIDLRQMPPKSGATGLHWQVSQATSLTNVVVEMSREPGNTHQGMFMENGSGGYMGDLIFRGGRYGIWIGNQQFTVRNLTIEDAQTGIYAVWNWGWTFQRLTIRNCMIGMYITTGALIYSLKTVGAEVILDAEISDTRTFIMTSASTHDTLAGSIVIDNARLINVGAAVAEEAGFVVLNGGDTTIKHWVQGNVYKGQSHTGTFKQDSLEPPFKPASLLDSEGKIFGRTRPQYADYDLSQIVSVKAQGAQGDGQTDDTAAIKKVFDEYAGCKIIFFDAGTYLVSSTITIPEGTKVVGELWSEIMGYGPNFQDQTNPVPVIQVGHPCSEGHLEISDMLFTTRGPAPGAIVVQWNTGGLAGQQGATGAWDTHIRLGASVGSQLGEEKCSKTLNNPNGCFAAFLALHLTPSSSAYIEGMWVWLGDHDLDNKHDQITVFSGRGVLSESAGPVWLIGTASEHHVIYQYNFAGAANHYIGLMQTETPYFQPTPASPVPFKVESRWHDPLAYQQPAAWAVAIKSSTNILIYGAGLYSFFKNNDAVCAQSSSCQDQIFTIDSTSTVHILSLSTVGIVYQLSIDGQALIASSLNGNGLGSTITSWESAPKRELCSVYTEFVVLPTAGYGFP